MKNLVLLLLVTALTFFVLGNQAREGLLSSDQDAVTATPDDVDIGAIYADTPDILVAINDDSDQTGQMTSTAPAISVKPSLLELMDGIDRSRYTAYPYQALARGGDAAVCRIRAASFAGTYSNCNFVTHDGAALLI